MECRFREKMYWKIWHPFVQDMGFEKPSGLIKPSKAGCGILPDVQSCTSVDDFASTCIIFGSIILFPLVWGYGNV